MIALRIAFFVAPWCFVWLIAIGCARRDSSSARLPVEEARAIEHRADDLVDVAPQGSGSDQLGRYAAIVRSHPDPQGLRVALTEFYTTWGESDGAAAVCHALVQNRSLLQSAFVGWARSDAEAPRRWVLAQTGDGRRQRWLAAGLMASLPVTDHRSRSEWLGQFAADAEFADLLGEVAIAWGKQRPGEALDWLGSLPDSGAKTDATEVIFQRWSELEPALAAQCLTRMRAGEVKDRAISALAKTIDRDDPEAARLWAESISDENLRQLTSRLLTATTGEREAAPVSAAPRPDLLSQAE